MALAWPPACVTAGTRPSPGHAGQASSGRALSRPSGWKMSLTGNWVTWPGEEMRSAGPPSRG